ncbi:type II toxin-antitoxin system VapC family toxin [uncultured Sphingomonas sp.]|uniref:type II toxin-antitoxin system VapC family toxin n=1 Tax=uncultured Sphingomonas sp. TaxID=158754 RepID=UPI0035C9475A
MTIVYPDTSIIVSAYTDEISTPISAAWIESIGNDDLTTSPWIETEIAAALAGKTRGRLISRDKRLALANIIRDLLSQSAVLIPIRQGHFTLAADFITRSEKPLRAGDALHLAIAADAGATIWTLDRPMVEAGQALALDVCLLT